MKKLLLTGLVIALATTGCTRITDTDVGIRQTWTGEIEDKVLTQGPHQLFTGNIIKVSKRNLPLTINTNPVTLEKVPMSKFVVKINYGIVPENAAIAYKSEKSQHKIVEDETFLMGKYIEDIADAAIQTAVSKYPALSVNDKRTEIETKIKEELNTRLKLGKKSKYAVVNEVNILTVQPHTSIVQSSLAIVNSQNALKTKQNELETARVEMQVKEVLAANASPKYIELQRVQAENTKAEAMLVAANKGTLNTLIVVPEKFTSLGQVK